MHWGSVAAPHQICCPARIESPTKSLPKFARACGRVSIGRHPDKRPGGRPRKERLSLLLASGSTAGGETGTARPHRATRLKATTERAFLVLPARMPGTPKRLVHL